MACIRCWTRALSALNCAKLVRDWLARRDTFQKLYADRFLHRKVYVKSLQSCSRVSVGWLWLSA